MRIIFNGKLLNTQYNTGLVFVTDLNEKNEKRYKVRLFTHIWWKFQEEEYTNYNEAKNRYKQLSKKLLSKPKIWIDKIILILMLLFAIVIVGYLYVQWQRSFVRGYCNSEYCERTYQLKP